MKEDQIEGRILPRAPEPVEGEVVGESDEEAAEEIAAFDFRTIRVEDPQLVEELAEAGVEFGGTHANEASFTVSRMCLRDVTCWSVRTVADR